MKKDPRAFWADDHVGNLPQRHALYLLTGKESCTDTHWPSSRRSCQIRCLYSRLTFASKHALTGFRSTDTSKSPHEMPRSAAGVPLAMCTTTQGATWPRPAGNERRSSELLPNHHQMRTIGCKGATHLPVPRESGPHRPHRVRGCACHRHPEAGPASSVELASAVASLSRVTLSALSPEVCLLREDSKSEITGLLANRICSC